jgi:excisionase family DNA binding protein
MTKEPPVPPPLLMTVRETALVLQIDRPKVYELIREGEIEGVKIGADWRIKRDSVERLTGPIPEQFFLEPSSDNEG